MTNSLLQIKVKERLNKTSSMDYDNIECWQVSEAFNKAQLEWVRRQYHGTNQTKEGDDSSKLLIDDLQILSTDTKTLTGWTITKQDGYYKSSVLPSDYLFYKRMSVKCKSDCCPEERAMIVYLVQVADIDNLLIDNFKQPSSVWGETLCTLQSNYAKIYTNNEFELTKPVLYYYRHPRVVQFINCANPSNTTVSTVDVECEFKDDIVEILIDETCSILAGDIESTSQYQRNKQNATSNN